METKITVHVLAVDTPNVGTRGWAFGNLNELYIHLLEWLELEKHPVCQQLLDNNDFDGLNKHIQEVEETCSTWEISSHTLIVNT